MGGGKINSNARDGDRIIDPAYGTGLGGCGWFGSVDFGSDLAPFWKRIPIRGTLSITVVEYCDRLVVRLIRVVDAG